jgi:transcription antitermination protein NusB
MKTYLRIILTLRSLLKFWIYFMLNRRHLRVKVLQSLYAFFQSGNSSLNAGEKELLHGTDKIYDLYLYQLSLIINIKTHAGLISEENKLKRLPSKDDLHPNLKFFNNECLANIENNIELQTVLDKRKINWTANPEIPRKLFIQFRDSSYYQEYMEKEGQSFDEDCELIVKLLRNFICEYELLHHFYEEKSIYWLDDWELVNLILIKSIKLMYENNSRKDFKVLPLFKDPDDRRFAIDLFHKTILNDKEFVPLIAAKTQNWDIERIALMDIIIMKMALTEILKFPEIPIKVSLNEYIELSKMYSTPKSKVFVNGVLDKLVEELISEKKISKLTGK